MYLRRNLVEVAERARETSWATSTSRTKQDQDRQAYSSKQLHVPLSARHLSLNIIGLQIVRCPYSVIELILF